MKRAVLVTCLLFISTCVACPGTTTHRKVTPMPPVVTDSHLCHSAGVRLNELNCKEGKPIDMQRSCSSDRECEPGHSCTAGGCFASWDKFCADTQAAGIWLDPGCIAKIASCDQINQCPPPKDAARGVK